MEEKRRVVIEAGVEIDDGGMVLVFGALCAVSGFLVGVLAHILWGFL